MRYYILSEGTTPLYVAKDIKEIIEVLTDRNDIVGYNNHTLHEQVEEFIRDHDYYNAYKFCEVMDKYYSDAIDFWLFGENWTLFPFLKGLGDIETVGLLNVFFDLTNPRMNVHFVEVE